MAIDVNVFWIRMKQLPPSLILVPSDSGLSHTCLRAPFSLSSVVVLLFCFGGFFHCKWQIPVQAPIHLFFLLIFVSDIALKITSTSNGQMEFRSKNGIFANFPFSFNHSHFFGSFCSGNLSCSFDSSPFFSLPLQLTFHHLLSPNLLTSQIITQLEYLFISNPDEKCLSA